MVFAKLSRVRALLASCSMVNTEPATHAALMDAINELDDALVMAARAHYAAQSSLAPDQMARLATFAGAATISMCEPSDLVH